MANRFWPPPLLRTPPPRPKVEQRAGQVTPWGDWGTSYGTGTGVSVNADSSLGLPAVYGCVQLIADTIAMLPKDVYREDADGTKTELASPLWLEQPNENDDSVDFITQTLTSLLLEGNAYWAYGANLNKQPTEMYVLDPTTVDVRARARNGRDPFAYGNGRVVEYFVNGALFAGNLIHIKAISRPGALKGVSPLEAARQALGLGIAAEQYAASFFANGTVLSGILSTDADLTEDQAKGLAQAWQNAHGGPYNAHKIGVLDQGAKFESVSVTPEQAEFLDSRKYSAAAVCSQIFLVDPTWFGLSMGGQSLTYQNLEQRSTATVTYTLMRWVNRLERAYYKLLPRPQYVKFNLDALKRADLKARMESYRIGLGATQPFLTVNEVRELEDLPPVPDGDTIKTAPEPAPAQMNPFAPPPVPNGNGQPATVGAADGT